MKLAKENKTGSYVPLVYINVQDIRSNNKVF